MGDELEQQLAGKTLDDIRHALPCSHPIQIELDKLEQANKELAEYKCGVEVVGVVVNEGNHIVRKRTIKCNPLNFEVGQRVRVLIMKEEG